MDNRPPARQMRALTDATTRPGICIKTIEITKEDDDLLQGDAKL